MSIIRIMTGALKGKKFKKKIFVNDRMYLVFDTDNAEIIKICFAHIDELLSKNNKSGVVFLYNNELVKQLYSAEAVQNGKAELLYLSEAKLKNVCDYISTYKNWYGDLIGQALVSYRIISEYDYTGYSLKNLIESKNCNLDTLICTRLLLI
ncbi:MAG: hypothetical protein K5755_01055 [Clostridiales bacterium]|nr:hypothetical protein [Clostridiales bacterium]